MAILVSTRVSPFQTDPHPKTGPTWKITELHLVVVTGAIWCSIARNWGKDNLYLFINMCIYTYLYIYIYIYIYTYNPMSDQSRVLVIFPMLIEYSQPSKLWWKTSSVAMFTWNIIIYHHFIRQINCINGSFQILIDGSKTLFVARTGSPLFIGNICLGIWIPPSSAPFFAPSIHHWIE